MGVLTSLNNLKMKNRIICLALQILATAFVCSSQVCLISDTNDTVEVTNCSLAGENKVEVTVSNDSNDINANVTITIEVIYKLNSQIFKDIFKGKGMAKKCGSTVITIRITSCYNGDDRYKPYSVSATGISGSKCM